MKSKTDGLIEKVFNVGARSELLLRSHSGDIKVRGWDVDAVRVRVSGDDDELEEEDVRFSHEGNRLTITSNYGPGGIFSMDYELEVPRDCRVMVHTVEGEVSVENVAGGGEVQATTGEVSLADVSGEFRIKTANGDLEVEGMSGYLAFNTANGDAEITRSHLTGFSFENANGNVNAETTLSTNGDYRVKTVSGDLELSIPPATRATVKLNTQNGEVDCELPAEVVRSSRRHWEVRLNGGGASVQMDSVNGDLRIEASEHMADEPAPAWEPPTAEPETPSANSAILEALARGEIGVDEAMAQLDQVER